MNAQDADKLKIIFAVFVLATAIAAAALILWKEAYEAQCERDRAAQHRQFAKDMAAAGYDGTAHPR